MKSNKHCHMNIFDILTVANTQNNHSDNHIAHQKICQNDMPGQIMAKTKCVEMRIIVPIIVVFKA